MCGISGFFSPNGFKPEEGARIAEKMSKTIAHRGPDDSGVWVDGNAGIALSHRRLSILELSAAGHQPMISASGRYVLIFNGEIYNYRDIRKDIEVSGVVSWRGHSDTETLLAGFELWGFESTIKKTVGTFGIALWDRKNRELLLTRDRMGEKPLYYGWQGDSFLFGSELKALRAHKLFVDEIEHSVLESYLKYGYISAPLSIYKDIFKLLPGSYIRISSKEEIGISPQPTAYWSLEKVASAGLNQPFVGSDSEAIDLLEETLIQSVSLQRNSDVPLGAFLSGGIDSSLVVALLQSMSSKKIKTYTIGFEEKKYNEAEHAETIANYIGTDHTTLYLSEQDIIKSIPEINHLYDEPFSDSSASLLVSRLAKSEVTVALSGDGGDEAFCGYSAYQSFNNIWTKFDKIPMHLRMLLSKFILMTPSSVITKSLTPLLASLNKSTSIPVGIRVQQLARAMVAKGHNEFFYLMKSNGGIEKSLINNRYQQQGKDITGESVEFSDIVNSMLYYDAKDYLSGDILVKADRASMSVGLENRAPLLDHRIIELAWKLPIDMKNRSGVSKWPLRQVLYRHIPQKLVDRPKMGFNLPASEWIRGPLKDWFEGSLNSDVLKREGFFDVENVQNILSQHMSGKHNWQAILWRLAAFQSWSTNR